MSNNYRLVHNVFRRVDDVLDSLSEISHLCSDFDLDKSHERRAFAFITDAQNWLSIASSELRASIHDYDTPKD